MGGKGGRKKYGIALFFFFFHVFLSLFPWFPLDFPSCYSFVVCLLFIISLLSLGFCLLVFALPESCTLASYFFLLFFIFPNPLIFSLLSSLLFVKRSPVLKSYACHAHAGIMMSFGVIQCHSVSFPFCGPHAEGVRGGGACPHACSICGVPALLIVAVSAD